MSRESELEAELARAKKELEDLKKRSEGGLSYKVSEKGGLSVYGLGRFPVTLYKEQWLRLLDKKDEILDFIGKNSAKLKTKS